MRGAIALSAVIRASRASPLHSKELSYITQPAMKCVLLRVVFVVQKYSVPARLENQVRTASILFTHSNVAGNRGPLKRKMPTK